ncbi:CRISPR-associated family protein [Vitreoscilla filiformis]|uniref:CRISPR-associated family protein n=1 Tax=Vitreoscilla filiformis TaxID=63 RepID=A0A221KFU7_VITFI|nr:CRISPR-associated ring nuclease Csm6 [Vitreoscilla filiformis]ASM77908.1 CRISPR-associated family protein [Vitreoscilla filiformis]
MTLDAASTSPQRPKRILVCVSGTSPAIVTETLYALVSDESGPFLPDEIHVITTTVGRQKIRDHLLHPTQGHFLRMVQEFPHKFPTPPRFDDSTLHVIANKTTGIDLADIVSLDDNRAAAQTIYRVLRELKTQPGGAQIHASVAGGRKSMSFYMGQAFSLLADEGDVLSHVLVSEPFENPGYGFFYPPATPRELTDRFSKLPPCHTADARLELAQMSTFKLGPVLRTALPAAALEDFDEAVNLAQGLIASLDARLAVRTQGHNRSGVLHLLGHTIKLPPAQFCLLLLHATAQQLHASGQIERTDLLHTDSTLTFDDWNAIGEACNLSRWKATQAPHAETAFSRIIGLCQPKIGAVAQRLRIEAIQDRRQLTANAPQFRVDIASTPLRLCLERIVKRMAA